MTQLSSDSPERHSFQFELPSKGSISEKKKEIAGDNPKKKSETDIAFSID